MQKFPYSKVEVSFLCSISLNSVEFTSENDILFFFFFFLLVLLVAKKRGYEHCNCVILGFQETSRTPVHRFG
jgi:hypothetical protein